MKPTRTPPAIEYLPPLLWHFASNEAVGQGRV
jgi:hypothetical protein